MRAAKPWHLHRWGGGPVAAVAAAVLRPHLPAWWKRRQHKNHLELPLQEAMFGEEEAGAPHSNKDSALIIAYEAVSTGLLTDMVTYLGMLEFESRKDLVGAAASFGATPAGSAAGTQGSPAGDDLGASACGSLDCQQTRHALLAHACAQHAQRWRRLIWPAVPLGAVARHCAHAAERVSAPHPHTGHHLWGASAHRAQRRLPGAALPARERRRPGHAVRRVSGSAAAAAQIGWLGAALLQGRPLCFLSLLS